MKSYHSNEFRNLYDFPHETVNPQDILLKAVSSTSFQLKAGRKYKIRNQDIRTDWIRTDRDRELGYEHRLEQVG